jgi:hypothetical protein
LGLRLGRRDSLSGMNDQSEDSDQPPPAGRAVVKRRWAIVSKAGGGAAVLAIAGAIALGDPADQSDHSQDPQGGSSHISAEA